jgi:hypothetical protein
MDPLGFALENFDAIGLWRTTEGNQPIDASGELPDGTKITGPADMKRVLATTRKDDFVGTLIEKLLTYALGRGTEYYDEPAVRQIMRITETDNYRWSSIIGAIVRSVPFQMRQAPKGDDSRVTLTTTGAQQR